MEDVRHGIYVFGLPRSGHTAIMYWLGRQLLPEGDFSTYPAPGEGGWCGLSPDLGIVAMNVVHKPNWPELLSAKRATLDQRPLMFVDDQRESANLPGDIRHRYHECTKRLPRAWTPVVFVMRDYYNNWASGWKRVEMGVRNPEAFGRLAETWTTLAKEAMGETNGVSPKTVVLYNQWVASKDYRREVCQTVQLPFTDRGFDYIPFPGSSFHSPPTPESICERWTDVPLDRLRKTVTPEVERLNEALFGMTPPWKI